MPELPEAETIARELAGAITGKVVGEVILSRPDIVRGDLKMVTQGLRGRSVIGVARRAKRVILRFDGAQLTFRLGMSGRLDVCEAAAPVENHTHLRMAIGGTEKELRFRDPRRFGGVWCSPIENGAEQGSGGPSKVPADAEDDLGPEPLELTSLQFRRILQRPRQIKALLMDQRAIAGLGNIYCDESLHAAGIHPLRLANSLNDQDADRLLRGIKTILRRAIRHNGTTLMDYRRPNGAEGSFQRHHRVYHREGQPCRSCGTAIKRILAAGRSTFFCPRCQRLLRRSRLIALRASGKRRRVGENSQPH